MTDHPSGTLDIEAAEALEKQFDSSLVTRYNGAWLASFMYCFSSASAASISSVPDGCSVIGISPVVRFQLHQLSPIVGGEAAMLTRIKKSGRRNMSMSGTTRSLRPEETLLRPEQGPKEEQAISSA